MSRRIPRNVVVLGFVSFLTDVSSEIIYPFLPMFVTSVLGAGAAFLGVIEGVAESTAALLKLVSGVWADRARDRSKLVLAGYSLSSFSRPLIAAATSAYVVLGVRFADRIGKGLRTSPRDAIIADSTPASMRGRAFGFQRSMDHAGAVVGPLIAMALLRGPVRELRQLFWLAAIPGVLAVLLVLAGVREVAHRAPHAVPLPVAWPRGVLQRYLLVLLLFTLGNSSDAFLLLRAGQLGVRVPQLPLLWVVFHLVKMGSAMPFGALSDGIGRRGVIAAGWTVYALTYLGFALATSAAHAWWLMAVYGLFYGLTEGVERALLADLAPPSARGQAYGWYHGVVGIGALPASVIFGVLWQQLGPQAAFGWGVALALASTLLLVTVIRPGNGRPAESAISR